MALRSDKILQAASARSSRHVDSLPAGRGPKYRQNCLHISAVCKALLSLRPPRAPTCPAIAEEGSLKFQNFPSGQTLYNSYRTLVEIWREAYGELNNMSVLHSRLDVNAVTFHPSELAPMDTSTRNNILLLQALLKESRNRQHAMQEFIKKEIPYRDPNAGPIAPLREPALTADLRAEIASWLARLDSGSSEFEVDELGVRINRRSRPGNLVMSRRLLEALRTIARIK